MPFNRRQFVASSLLAAARLSMLAPSTGIAEAADTFQSGDDEKMVSLGGRVICLTEELQKLYRVAPDCETRGHVYTLKAKDGKLYPFLPTETAAAVWMDERFRTRDLQITARLFPQTNFIEVIKLQSWLKGKLHDLYYFCDVCAITTHKPGPCECCQEPVEFRETPAEQVAQSV